MKWIMISFCMLCLNACTYVNTQLVEYPEVIVTPPYPAMVDYDAMPIDVTSTNRS